MEIKSINLKGKIIENNVFLAPMAGYTDYGFRKLCLNNGAGFCFTELVSAKGIVYKNKGSKDLLFAGVKEGQTSFNAVDTAEDKFGADYPDLYGKTAAQLFGNDPVFLRKAIEDDLLKDYEVIDVNMGCPVPKVYKNGEGSALLADRKRAEEIVKECVKTGRIITVKIRTGLKEGDDIAADFSKAMEDAGASLITVHGRVRERYYSGEADFKAIEKAKNAVKIPVIANGGIFTEEDADTMIERTGADGVMIARGAIADPFIFSRILKKPVKEDLKTFMDDHLKYLIARFGAERGAKEFRKFTPYYFKGAKNSKDFRSAINVMENGEDIRKFIASLDI